MTLKPSIKIARKKTGDVLRGVLALARKPNAVKVGFPAGEAGGDIIDRAVWTHFGTSGSGKGFNTSRGGGFGGPVPPRPFLANAMRDNRSKYLADMKRAQAELWRTVAQGGNVAAQKRRALDKLGIAGQGDIQREITALRSPPNSPVTIAIKGSSNPLVDSGQMRQSVTWKVDD